MLGEGGHGFTNQRREDTGVAVQANGVASAQQQAPTVDADTPVDLHVRLESGDHPDLAGRGDAADNVLDHVREGAVGLAGPATFATGISPMAPWNLTNVSSAITDEAKNPPIRTIRIDANKFFFMTAPPFLFFYFLKVEREISVKEVADLSIKDQVHYPVVIWE